MSPVRLAVAWCVTAMLFLSSCAGHRQRLASGDSVVFDPTEYVGVGGQVYWVAGADPAASDANPGSPWQPWRTISRAAATAGPGDVVVIRGGTYRETVTPARGGTSATARITYVGYPGEEVVVSGADVRTDWVADGLDWCIPWQLSLPVPTMPSYYREAYKFALRREQVIENGRMLRQVASRSSLAPGRFWVEGTATAPTRLCVRTTDGSSALDKTMEVSTRSALWNPPSTVSYLRVKNLIFRYATNAVQKGAMLARGTGHLIEDVVVEWTNGNGVRAEGNHVTYRRVIARHNGQIGWVTAPCDQCLIEDSKTLGNNWKDVDAVWEAGGTKFAFSDNLVVRRFEARDNKGPGVWWDIENYGGVLEDSFIDNNERLGVVLEYKTYDIIVRNNVVTRTRFREYSGTGIAVVSAGRNTIVHNTLIGNEDVGLTLGWWGDRRTPVTGNRLYNNLLVNNAGGVRIAIDTSLTDAQSNTLDGNLYWPATSSLFRWDVVGQSYWQGSSLTTWRQLVGTEGRSRILDPRVVNAQDPAGWHLTSSSPAIGAGVAVGVPVLTDIERDPRPTAAADIGADQYRP